MPAGRDDTKALDGDAERQRVEADTRGETCGKYRSTRGTTQHGLAATGKTSIIFHPTLATPTSQEPSNYRGHPVSRYAMRAATAQNDAAAKLEASTRASPIAT
jgi:hypothetical protein